MRYLSVCSGIEAATVAWHPLGWTPFAFAEIEKFPSVSNSSMISSITYDRESKELIVTFNNGGEYKYLDVPPEIFDQMSTMTEGLGKFFTANVKNKYQYVKI